MAGTSVRSSMLGYRHVLGQFKLARASCSLEKLLLLVLEKPLSQLCSHTQTHNTEKKTSCAQHDGASLRANCKSQALSCSQTPAFLQVSFREPPVPRCWSCCSGHLWTPTCFAALMQPLQSLAVPTKQPPQPTPPLAPCSLACPSLPS